MWAWVYQSTIPETKDSYSQDQIANTVPMYHGQLLLQDEAQPTIFWTWNRTQNRWGKVESVAPESDKQTNIAVWDRTYGWVWEPLWRLDYFNCKNYNLCTPDGLFGSHYGTRSAINVYNDAGQKVDTISPPDRIVFGAGYGFSKADQTFEMGSGTGSLRVSGKRVNGVDTKYSSVYWAAVDFKLHPTSYPINTA